MTDEKILELAVKFRVPQLSQVNELLAFARAVEEQTIEACDDALLPIHRSFVRDQDYDSADIVESCSIAICELYRKD